jgi:hypothetical protein
MRTRTGCPALIAAGPSNAEIATTLFVSQGTVKTHVTRILAQLALRDRVQAAVLAYETGLIRPGTDSSPTQQPVHQPESRAMTLLRKEASPRIVSGSPMSHDVRLRAHRVRTRQLRRALLEGLHAR